jgi:hypothetical protein
MTDIPHKKLELAVIVSNGLQRIQRIKGKSMISDGTQIIFSPKNLSSINWSTFITTEHPKNHIKYRYFNNLYCIFEINSKLKLNSGIYFGAELMSFKSF